MAEALLSNQLTAAGYDIEVRSAGLGALVGSAADPISQQLMLNRNLDITQHRAQQLDVDLLQWADLILTMDKMQSHEVQQKYPRRTWQSLSIG